MHCCSNIDVLNSSPLSQLTIERSWPWIEFVEFVTILQDSFHLLATLFPSINATSFIYQSWYYSILSNRNLKISDLHHSYLKIFLSMIFWCSITCTFNDFTLHMFKIFRNILCRIRWTKSTMVLREYVDQQFWKIPLHPFQHITSNDEKKANRLKQPSYERNRLAKSNSS